MVTWVILWLKRERGKCWTCQRNILEKQNWHYLREEIFQNVPFFHCITERLYWNQAMNFLSDIPLNVSSWAKYHKKYLYCPLQYRSSSIDLHRVIIWVKISILVFYLQSNLFEDKDLPFSHLKLKGLSVECRFQQDIKEILC